MTPELPPGPGTRAEFRFPTVGIELLYSPAEGRCLADAGKLIHEAVGFDMSLGGLAFDVRIPLELGSHLVVAIASPGGAPAERMLAEVRWCRPLPDGGFRIGTRIVESEAGDVPTVEATDEERLGTGPEVPAEIACVCPACGAQSTFRFEGAIRPTSSAGILPLYTCSACSSTRSIVSLLAANRGGGAAIRGRPLAPASGNGGDLVRTTIRVFTSSFVAFRHGEDIAIGRILDMSYTGAFIQTEHEVPLDTEIQVKLSPPDAGTASLVLRARVSRHQPADLEAGRAGGLGVQFVEPEASVAERLHELMEAHPVRQVFEEGTPVTRVEGLDLPERFDVRRLIGSGGTSEVYEAFDRDLDEEVALKILSREAARDPGVLTRLRREIRLNRKIKSPHVASIYEFGDLGDRHYLTMELVRGQSLDQIIREEGPRDQEVAVRLAAQILEGLAAVHRVGILHRDVKPSNVMITPEGTAILLDFGIARRPDDPDLTQSSTVVGTPAYMAPEQFEDRPLTPAADVYAFGCTLFHMLTGRPPFDAGRGPLDLGIKHISQEPPPVRSLRPEVGRHLERFLQRCLEKAPERRFADGPELLDALGRLDDESTTSTGRARVVTVVGSETPERQALIEALQGRRLWVTAEASALGALEHVLRQPPDVIVLRFPVSDMAGSEILMVLGQHAPTREVPVVVLSEELERDRGLSTSLGRADVLPADLDADELARTVQDLATRGRG